MIGKKNHIKEETEKKSEREIWKETDLLLVSGVGLNGKRDDKGDMERERWVEGESKREICVLFHYSLWSVISWEEVREMVGLFFLFFSWISFFFAVSPNQLLHFSLSLTLPPLFPLLSLVSTLKWKFKIVLTRPFALME